MTEQLDFIPDHVREFTGDEEIVLWKLDDLKPNEKLLRGKIAPNTLASIKANGLQYPIMIAELIKGGYEIVDGEQRVKIFRKLQHETIPAILHPDKLTKLQVSLLRAQMNNARQDNPVSDIQAIRDVLEEAPSSSVKALSIYTSMPQSKVRKYLKQAKMPQIFIDAVSDGTMSPDTLTDLANKPKSVQNKAKEKYIEERSKVETFKGEDGDLLFRRKEDTFVYAKPPILLSQNDVKDFQRVSVENKVTQAPMSLTVDFQETVEGFAVVQNGKFVTDLLEHADEARLEIGRKKNCVVVRVVSI